MLQQFLQAKVNGPRPQIKIGEQNIWQVDLKNAFNDEQFKKRIQQVIFPQLRQMEAAANAGLLKPPPG